jgi:hypothetical protein
MASSRHAAHLLVQFYHFTLIYSHISVAQINSTINESMRTINLEFLLLITILAEKRSFHTIKYDNTHKGYIAWAIYIYRYALIIGFKHIRLCHPCLVSLRRWFLPCISTELKSCQ